MINKEKVQERPNGIGEKEIKYMRIKTGMRKGGEMKKRRPDVWK